MCSYPEPPEERPLESICAVLTNGPSLMAVAFSGTLGDHCHLEGSYALSKDLTMSSIQLMMSARLVCHHDDSCTICEAIRSVSARMETSGPSRMYSEPIYDLLYPPLD